MFSNRITNGVNINSKIIVSWDVYNLDVGNTTKKTSDTSIATFN